MLGTMNSPVPNGIARLCGILADIAAALSKAGLGPKELGDNGPGEGCN